MRKAFNLCDYFVICSGSSLKRVQAIAEAIEEKLDNRGFRHRPVQGKDLGLWVLLDYGDIIVHVFYHEMRRFYDLEYLWQDAPRINLTFGHR